MRTEWPVTFDELNTPQEGHPQEVEFVYSKGIGQTTHRRGMVVDLYETPSIKLFNIPTGDTPPKRQYSTFSVDKIVGPITLIGVHPEWVAPMGK